MYALNAARATEDFAVIDFDKMLILDGATGSLLTERSGAPAGYRPEMLNVENPDVVYSVHRDYVEAGSDVVYTNTFGANPLKLGDETGKIIRAAISIARKAAEGKAYVALDVGPLGKLIGEGGISFEEAYENYAAVIKAAEDKTDLIVIETMTDIADARAALLAAKENSSLPVMLSMSFEENGRSAFGTDVESFARIISGMGVAAIGINCSLGPVEMLPMAEKLIKSTRLPVFIKPNAGMPRFKDGKTVYDIDKTLFCKAMKKIHALGVNILGGCCGTTPEYIRDMAAEIAFASKRPAYVPVRALSCSTATVTVDSMKVVGERINPTGKKKFQAALREGDFDYILSQGIEQAQAGADILDVNVGLNGTDEKGNMVRVVDGLQKVVSKPLVLDSSSPEVLEAALRRYHGKALINSVNGKKSSIESVLPLAKKYGAAVVCLALDENGIPFTVEGRVAIGKKLVEECLKAGIAIEDIYVDTLTMAESAERGSALCTLGALGEIKKTGAGTILGVSNVSFGMPHRENINACFLAMAKEAGLDLAIINPSLTRIKASDEAEDFLLGKEGAAEAYIAYAAKTDSVKAEDLAPSDAPDMTRAIVGGMGTLAKETAEKLLEKLSPMDVAAKHIIPALDKVGELYESGKIFLPQLIAAADSAKQAFAALEEKMKGGEGTQGDKRFVLATVKGDIHDIGKNIVKAVVANYGYKVVDLGRDVDYKVVLDAVESNYPCVLGLSALMTTTAQNMAETIRLVRERYPDIPVLVGGAVITPEYAESIGGVYCKDAAATVKALKDIYK